VSKNYLQSSVKIFYSFLYLALTSCLKICNFNFYLQELIDLNKLAKKHVFSVSQTLAFVCWQSQYRAHTLKPNGPAIWGGCVTRSCPDRSVGDSTGQSPGTLAAKLSRCKEGMAQFLPVSVTDEFVSVAGFVQSRSQGLCK
jgi:hypothetical protein